MQYKNIHRIEKFKNVKNQEWKTHFFKNNSKPNKIQEHSRTFKDFKDQWRPCLHLNVEINEELFSAD